MKPIRNVLRLLAEGASERAASRSCNVSRQAVQDYKFRAQQAGMQWPLPEDMDDYELEERLFPSAARDAHTFHPQPNWADVVVQMKHKGATLKILHEEYLREHPAEWATCAFARFTAST